MQLVYNMCYILIFQSSVSLMMEELEQVAPTISQNPFLKNDQKRLSKMKSLLPSFRALKERETYDEGKEDIEEESVDEREHSVQRDYLKQELDQVLKGIREMGDEGDVEKHDEESSDLEDNPDVIKVALENMNGEESIDTKVEPCERSTSRISEASDIILAFEDTTEEHKDVGDNTLEEISAL